MFESDVVGNLDGRDLIWLTVLGSVLRQPLTLGELVVRLEALVLDELDGSPRHISRCLHEMDRGGHIVLANVGRGWRVSLGPRGRETFLRLMGAADAPNTPSLAEIGRRIRAGFAALTRAASAA